MAVTNMTWTDLESLVADSVRKKYASLSEDKKRIFCRNLREADKRRLNYDNKYSGVSYALWFHMQRLDNICVAIDAVHRKHPLPQNLYSLDIGSGTSCGAMAIAYWAATTFLAPPIDIQIECVEPVEHMRSIAKNITHEFREHFFESLSAPAEVKFDCSFSQFDSLESFPIENAKNTFNLILFNHTFRVMTADEENEKQDKVLQVVKNYLSRNGAVIFLTPYKPQEKQAFMTKVRNRLVTAGFSRIPTRYINSKSTYKSHHSFYDRSQKLICQLRHELNSEHIRFFGSPAFGNDPYMDFPYYGFSCSVDAFTW